MLGENSNGNGNGNKNKTGTCPSPRSRLFRDLAAGACTGAFTKTAVAPLERVKVLHQLQTMMHRPGETRKYQGIFQTLQTLFRAEGVAGFYKGNGANVARVLPVHGLKFGMNDFFKRVVAPGQSNLSTSQLLQAGVLAGLTQQCTTLPLEVVRTRMTVGAALQPPMVYKGILDCLGTIVRTEGVFGLYKGFTATIISGVPFVALQMTLYGELRSRIPRNPDGSLAIAWLVPAGMVSGIAAQILTYPGDTIRKLMIVNGVGGSPRLYMNTWAVWDAQGIRGFYGGIRANVVRAIPEASLQFACYEAVKSFLDGV